MDKKKNRGVATLRNKEEQTIDICNNKNDSKKLYAKWNKSDSKGNDSLNYIKF